MKKLILIITISSLHTAFLYADPAPTYTTEQIQQMETRIDQLNADIAEKSRLSLKDKHAVGNGFRDLLDADRLEKTHLQVALHSVGVTYP